MRWELEHGDCGESWWVAYHARGLGYSIDPDGGVFRTVFHCCDGDAIVGPPRKTLRAAVNDCKRHARKMRAALVEFNDISVPE
jgi:hypothetical protein